MVWLTERSTSAILGIGWESEALIRRAGKSVVVAVRSRVTVKKSKRLLVGNTAGSGT
jgi:hypothetical protein